MEGATIERLAAGIRLKKGEVARPAAVRRIDDRGSYGRLEVVLTEGKNREIRRMMEAVGFKVLKLVRTRIGPVTLEGLQIGRWRDLTPGEVKEILRAGRPAAKAHLLQKA
jgi:pseudouridine synthase